MRGARQGFGILDGVVAAAVSFTVILATTSAVIGASGMVRHDETRLEMQDVAQNVLEVLASLDRPSMDAALPEGEWRDLGTFMLGLPEAYDGAMAPLDLAAGAVRYDRRSDLLLSCRVRREPALDGRLWALETELRWDHAQGNRGTIRLGRLVPVPQVTGRAS